VLTVSVCHMSAWSKDDLEEQPEDADLGLGHGCQPGGLPPFEILRRSRPSNLRAFESSACQNSDGIQTVKQSTNPLMKLSSKLGFCSKTKCVPLADDGNIQPQSESDTVALGTSLKQEKLMFERDMMNIRRRQNIDLQPLGTSGGCTFALWLLLPISQ